MWVYVPFFFIPLTALTVSAAGAWDTTASDMLAMSFFYAGIAVLEISNFVGERKL
jgi:hypothetical protein